MTLNPGNNTLVALKRLDLERIQKCHKVSPILKRRYNRKEVCQKKDWNLYLKAQKTQLIYLTAMVNTRIVSYPSFVNFYYMYLLCLTYVF